jgi:hypothetical protein
VVIYFLAFSVRLLNHRDPFCKIFSVSVSIHSFVQLSHSRHWKLKSARVDFERIVCGSKTHKQFD